jgi:hypothetical protein
LRDPEERVRLIAALQGDRRANDDARRLLISAALIYPVLAVVYWTDRAPWLRVPVAYFLPILITYPLLLAALLYVRGRATMPRLVLALGIVITVGGVLLDMGMTALKTPTLALEANPIARTLLDSHHPVAFVYWYAIVAQGLYTAVICLLWGALLRHRLTLLFSARRGGASGKPAFLKAALGGGELTWRQFLFPIRFSELPTAYHMVWLFCAVLMGTGPYRVYLGLCWLGWASFEHELAACTIAITLTTATYFAWLTVEAWKFSPQSEGVAP